jgi:hypothetical protein
MSAGAHPSRAHDTRISYSNGLLKVSGAPLSVPLLSARLSFFFFFFYLSHTVSSSLSLLALLFMGAYEDGGSVRPPHFGQSSEREIYRCLQSRFPGPLSGIVRVPTLQDIETRTHLSANNLLALYALSPHSLVARVRASASPSVSGAAGYT